MSRNQRVNLQDAASVRRRLEELHDYIRSGRIMEAMREFYHPEVVMEEPAYGATEGLEANLEREQKFLDGVREFKSFEVPRMGTAEGSSFYENAMDWIATDGTPVHVEQVVVADWKDGKIIRERFYYDHSP